MTIFKYHDFYLIVELEPEESKLGTLIKYPDKEEKDIKMITGNITYNVFNVIRELKDNDI